MTAPHPSAPPQETVAANLTQIRARIARAAAAAGRRAEDVTLVAVSKTFDANAVRAAMAAGQNEFGENRVQEAAAKFGPLRAEAPGLCLHLIGALQTNKAAEAVRLADTIQSVDRPRLVDALADAAQRAGRLPRVLVQVNVGAEAQKAGVSAAEADAFIDYCRARLDGAVQGLMCIPPAGVPPEPYFARLAAMRARHGLALLSMGMSGDFEVAVAAGATHVRVGSAVFGTRPPGQVDAALQQAPLQDVPEPL